MFKNRVLEMLLFAAVKVLVFTASILPQISAASDYYYEFQGTFVWHRPTAQESCQEWFDWRVNNSSGDSRYYNFRVVPYVSESIEEGQIYHCLYDLDAPHGTFLNQRGQVNRRGMECPQGMVFRPGLGGCVEGSDSCVSNPNAGNPVNMLTGGKKETYVDVEYAGMRIERGYSHVGKRGRWYFDFQESLNEVTLSNTDYLIYVHDGRIDHLREHTSECWKSDGSSCYQVAFGSSGTTLSKDGVEKTFTYGKVSRIVDRKDSSTIAYSRNGSSLMIERQGRSIAVDLNPDGTAKSIRWAKNRIDYDYGENGMLSQVDWNTGRVDYYLYEGKDGTLLRETGTNGEMYAQWGYDDEGRVTFSSRQAGIDRHEFQYNDDSVLVTNPLGKEALYSYAEVAGINRLVQVQGYPTDNCVGSFRQITYYPNGMVQTKVDESGTVTRYRYNDRLLEVERIVAEGSENEHKIQTHWHERFNLKTRIVEPESTTIFNYDEEGRLLSTQIVGSQ